MTKMGQAAIFETRGNAGCHVVLRGGKEPNHGPEHVDAACAALRAAGPREQVMVDVSHANSQKQHRRQAEIAGGLAERIARGERRISGVMIESHLEEGRQERVVGQPLQRGVSITDACLGWEQTVPVLCGLAAAVRQRRSADGAKPLDT
jgi:3-deoxy-7-phosphoheptulonate synthase